MSYPESGQTAGLQSQPSRGPDQVESSLKDLTEIVEYLKMKVGDLHKRLGPVLTERQDSDKRAQEAPVEPLCDVASNITSLVFELRQITDEVSSLINNCRL